MKQQLHVVLALIISLSFFGSTGRADSQECVLAPELKAALKDINAKGNPLDSLTATSVVALRKDRDNAAQNVLKSITVKTVQDFPITVDSRSISVRIYTPEDQKLAQHGKLPLILFIHGGGWTLGDVITYDSIARRLAQATPALVASVDYSLAPEHPYPAAMDDITATLHWLTSHSVPLHIDLQRLAVAGDSGGGNLATVTAMNSRSQKDFKIVGEALFYPSTDIASLETSSFKEFGNGYLLTRKSVESFRQFYVPNAQDLKKETISPLRSNNLKGMPFTLIITAGCDPLRDEGKAYADKLKSVGVDVVYKNEPQMIHGYLNYFNHSKAVSSYGEATLDFAAKEIAATFSKK